TEIYTLSLHDALPISSLRAHTRARATSRPWPVRPPKAATSSRARVTSVKPSKSASVRSSVSTPTLMPWATATTASDEVKESEKRSEEHTSELQSRENL